MVEAVLLRQLNELKPKLTLPSYTARTLSAQPNIKPVNIKCLLHGELNAARTREVTEVVP